MVSGCIQCWRTNLRDIIFRIANEFQFLGKLASNNWAPWYSKPEQSSLHSLSSFADLNQEVVLKIKTSPLSFGALCSFFGSSEPFRFSIFDAIEEILSGKTLNHEKSALSPSRLHLIWFTSKSYAFNIVNSGLSVSGRISMSRCLFTQSILMHFEQLQDWPVAMIYLHFSDPMLTGCMWSLIKILRPSNSTIRSWLTTGSSIASSFFGIWWKNQKQGLMDGRTTADFCISSEAFWQFLSFRSPLIWFTKTLFPRYFIFVISFAFFFHFKINVTKNIRKFFMIALSLLLLIAERSLLTTLIDKWLLSTSAKHCLVDRPVKWSFKVRLLQLNVIILHSGSLGPEYNNWQLL